MLTMLSYLLKKNMNKNINCISNICDRGKALMICVRQNLSQKTISPILKNLDLLSLNSAVPIQQSLHIALKHYNVTWQLSTPWWTYI